MTANVIIPENKDPSFTLIILQAVSVISAGLFLYFSRILSILLVPAIVFLGMAVLLAGYSRYRLFSILIIGIFTSLILSLRFDYLPWGDPWFEYEMIQRIIVYHSIDTSVYPSQFPVVHVIIATISLLSGVNPLDLLKYIIPALSVIGLYALYKIAKDLSLSTKIAFFTGILLLCGTPYLHWTTQGVRETMGIALFILTLYISFTATVTHKKKYLAIALLLIYGLVITHDLSALLFLLSWISVSLTYLYLICDMNRIHKTSMFSLLIASATVIFIVAWVWGRSLYGYSLFNSLLNTVFHSEFGIPLFIASLIFLYLIPLKIPDKILVLRSMVKTIIIRKKIIYVGFIIITSVSSGVVFNFILGNAIFVLNYPLPMLFNGICMIILSLIGVYYFLETDRLHILAWISALSLVLVLSMSNIVPFVDPLRFIEFLYIPLVIIAAFGVAFILGNTRLSKVLPIMLAGFVIISVATSFPSSVFLGNSFEPGHPLFDTRSWVIQHQPSEIVAISWLNDYPSGGIIDTDAYVGYAARGIIQTNTSSIQTEYPFMRETYPQVQDTNKQRHNILIPSRMKDYTEFGIQWLQKREPLNDMDIQKINNECNLLYNNGNAKVYSFFSNMTSERYDHDRKYGLPLSE
jgi:hypothetical protein